tara:strand:- start:73 stop:489 length:417 start_codon:yes stop_codon:yes gene_type:complete
MKKITNYIKTMKKVKVYTNKTCPYCKQVKEELMENNIKFEEVLVEDNKKDWQAVVDLIGMSQLPTILFNREYLIPGRDFANEKNLVKLIQNKKPSNFSEQTQSLEKLKTLTFNIYSAFGRMQKLLEDIKSNTTKANKK